jgi:taurine---2-oxoglutarate transaminase
MSRLSAQDIVDLNKEYTFFSWSVQGPVAPIPMTAAHGVFFWDADGRRYLDFASQLVNMNIGHQHPKIVQAIQEQAARMAFAGPGFATEPRGLLGRKLAELTPGDIKKTFFCLGGAEANENAVKIARLVTGRHKIVARYRSYHGATHGAMSLSGDPRRLPAEPSMPGVVRILDPYCYRCPFGQKKELCRRECIRHIEEIIELEGPDRIAALILEGVTGSNGLIVPPDDYWPAARAICDRHGILLIADEVMSGWGRTGRWFAVDHWGVTPDIITTAKGITSGYVPLGAVMVREKIARFFDDKMLYAGLTYSGHPLACAAALATIEVYEQEGLIENSRKGGEYLGRRLEEIRERHSSVGDARYIGLFSALELVRSRATREILDPAPLMSWLREQGLYAFHIKNILFIVPPLCITEPQLEAGLGILERGLSEVTDKLVE